ncbi:histidinol dehydrogenase [Buchnera aphidicola]|uniref:histidinol dehydrogenase n=1 Tax=Buchnera aphidicola TaxID=9 RepID=UPI0022380283|nr:histidinol dehydrogenase [Buchnera aphidicola]MCW5197606.1 histidinol dehydrogenase [Buchnera aphidicola (Chaitophorus viminalis)]
MNNFKNIIFWKNLSKKKKKKILSRPIFHVNKKIKKNVSNIIKNVILKKDDALKKYSLLFDQVQLNDIKVSMEKINTADEKIDINFKKCIKQAIKNIYSFHIQQKSKNLNIETMPGVICEHLIQPIDSVGLYIPGGLFPLFSTFLMLVIPAKIAGCKNIFVCSPPPISEKILYIAKLFQINNIYQVGGAHAISALAFGTQSIPKVDKIFGPGNEYVTEAKRQLNSFSQTISIDMLAGPSELLIIADLSSNTDFIASDLLSQIEHGNKSQVILLTDSKEIACLVIKKIYIQIKTFKNSICIKNFFKKNYIIVTKSIKECIKISNQYAPEHLIIQTKNPRQVLKEIKNAGSIFLGLWSPESAGDYASGTNHVLPTYGLSRSCSGISVSDFLKKISVQELTQDGFLKLAPVLQKLSLEENMLAHKNSIDVRLSLLRNKKND